MQAAANENRYSDTENNTDSNHRQNAGIHDKTEINKQQQKHTLVIEQKPALTNLQPASQKRLRLELKSAHWVTVKKTKKSVHWWQL